MTGTVGLNLIDKNTWQISTLPNRTALRQDALRIMLWLLQNCKEGTYTYGIVSIPLTDIDPELYKNVTYNGGKKWLYGTIKFNLDDDSDKFEKAWMFERENSAE